MELLQLQYFLEVAKIGSVTKAASALHVSQSSLSQTIGRLEKELNIKLFEKDGRNIVLSAHGHKFYAHISRALGEIENAKTQLDPTKLHGQIVIGSYMLLHPIMPCIKAFAEQYPDVSFTFLHINVLGSVTNARMDALLCYDQSNALGFRERMLIASSPRLIVVPKGQAKEQYSLQDLENAEFVSLLYRNEDHEEIFDEFMHNNTPPNIRYQTNSNQFKSEILEAGLACGFTNGMLANQLTPTGEYRIAYHSPDEPKNVNIYMAWRNTSVLSPAAKAFKEFMQRFYEQPTD